MQYVTGTGQKMTVHDEHPGCKEHGCPIHHPSDHHMKTWPTNWPFNGLYLMQRMCKHSVAHPDPDSFNYLVRYKHRGHMTLLDLCQAHDHECDGCCQA